jgi:hypothetical protein
MPLSAAQMSRAHVQHALQHDLGMSSSAASSFARTWAKQGCNVAALNTMVLAAIDDQVDIFKNKATTYAMSLVDVWVEPHPDASPLRSHIHQLGLVVVGFRCYIMRPLHNDGPPKSFAVRIHAGGLQIRFCTTWLPFDSYLAELSLERYDRIMSTTTSGAEVLDRQLRWWRSNDRTFDFAGLPSELRNLVYDFYLQDPIMPYTRTRTSRVGRLAAPSKHRLALMRVNKQTHNELRYQMYLMHLFAFAYIPALRKALRNTTLLTNVTRITLAFTPSQLLAFFRFDLDAEPNQFQLPHAVNRHLRHAPLKSLAFYFGPPSLIAEEEVLEGACQIKAVDLIMTVAWPSVRGHHVELQGFVKDKQKFAIEKAARIEEDKFKQWAAVVKAATGAVSTLADYDEFESAMLADEPGGVRLDGKELEDEGPRVFGGVSVLSTVSLPEFLECDYDHKACHVFTWSN